MNETVSELLKSIGKNNNKPHRISVSLSDSDYELLMSYCKDEYKGYSGVIRTAIQEFLNKK